MSGTTRVAAGEEHIGAFGGYKTSTNITFTRPADTTAYTQKDVVAPATLTVTAATNASPIVLTTGTHGLADGDPVTVASVGGNTNANGAYYAKVTGYSSTTFALYSDKALTTPVAGNSAYTSGGTVIRVLHFADMARLNGGKGYIVKATLLTDQTSNTESFRLHLFSSRPTAIADNAACTAPLFADAAKYIGTLDFVPCRTEGSGATAAYSNMTSNTASSNLPLPFGAATSDTAIYALLETPNGFSPASGQGFAIKITSECD